MLRATKWELWGSRGLLVRAAAVGAMGVWWLHEQVWEPRAEARVACWTPAISRLCHSLYVFVKSGCVVFVVGSLFLLRIYF